MSQQHWVEGKDHLAQSAGSGLLCWLMSTVVPTKTPQFFFEKLLSDAPKDILVPGAIPHQSHNSSLCWASWGSHFSSLWRSLWLAGQPPNAAIAPPSSVSPAKLLRVKLLVHSSGSLIKMLLTQGWPAGVYHQWPVSCWTLCCWPQLSTPASSVQPVLNPPHHFVYSLYSI